MKKYLFSMLFLTVGLQAYSQENTAHGSMMEQVQQMMKEATEEDLLSGLNDRDRALYQQMNPEQKGLVLRIANQFSCHAHIQSMKKRMQEKLNQKEKINENQKPASTSF